MEQDHRPAGIDFLLTCRPPLPPRHRCLRRLTDPRALVATRCGRREGRLAAEGRRRLPALAHDRACLRARQDGALDRAPCPYQGPSGRVRVRRGRHEQEGAEWSGHVRAFEAALVHASQLHSGSGAGPAPVHHPSWSSPPSSASTAERGLGHRRAPSRRDGGLRSEARISPAATAIGCHRPGLHRQSAQGSALAKVPTQSVSLVLAADKLHNAASICARGPSGSRSGTASAPTARASSGTTMRWWTPWPTAGPTRSSTSYASPSHRWAESPLPCGVLGRLLDPADGAC